MHRSESRSIHLHRATEAEYRAELAAAIDLCLVVSGLRTAKREDRSALHPRLKRVTHVAAHEVGEVVDFDVYIYWHDEPEAVV